MSLEEVTQFATDLDPALIYNLCSHEEFITVRPELLRLGHCLTHVVGDKERKFEASASPKQAEIAMATLPFGD